MEKYYLSNYDRRVGGDFCEIFDENLNSIRIERGVEKIAGLQPIAKKGSITSVMYRQIEMKEVVKWEN